MPAHVVLIVGGGPVGLYTCLLFLEMYKDITVIIIEKRTTYTRSHQVYIDMCKIPTSDQYIEGVMSIQKVEEVLRHHCVVNSARVRILYIEVDATNYETLQSHQPSIIIFADGARSRARDSLFGGEKYRYHYTSACNVSYRRRFATESDHLQLNHNYRLQKLTGCYFHEQIKQDGEVRLVILGDYSNELLKYAARVIINVRRVELGDEVIEDTLHYSFFDLDMFQSKLVCSQMNGIPIYLVGDAAAGIPYQQGLNVGMQCARALVRGRRYYARAFEKILKKTLSTTDSHANTIDVYLSIVTYFHNNFLEWQRWSRSYENLLFRISQDETELFRDTFTLHPVTQDRRLVLEWWNFVLFNLCT